MSDITKADVANFVAALEKWSEGRSEKERKLLFFTLGQAAKSTKEGAAPRTPEVTGFRTRQASAQISRPSSKAGSTMS